MHGLPNLYRLSQISERAFYTESVIQKIEIIIKKIKNVFKEFSIVSSWITGVEVLISENHLI